MPIVNDYNMQEKYVDYQCDFCGKIFQGDRHQYQLVLNGKYKTMYCSKECHNNSKRNGIETTCDNCGKIIYRTQYRMNLNKHQYCSLKCQKKFIHKETYEIRQCEICGKEFECPKISTQRFCSNKCNSQWQTTVCGVDNPNFTQVLVKCDYCGKEIYVKHYKTLSQDHNFCSTECRQKWYAEIWSQREEFKETKRIIAAQILSSGAISKTNSKPQQIVDSLLDKLNIKYKREENFKYYAVDNYLNNFNLIIEVQGDYWHANPIKFQTMNQTQYNTIARDKRKHTYILNNHNIHILYLWESDIYNNQELCEKLIQEYIDNNGLLNNYNSFNYHLEGNNLILNSEIIYPYQERNVKEYKSLVKKIS